MAMITILGGFRQWPFDATRVLSCDVIIQGAANQQGLFARLCCRVSLIHGVSTLLRLKTFPSGDGYATLEHMTSIARKNSAIPSRTNAETTAQKHALLKYLRIAHDNAFT